LGVIGAGNMAEALLRGVTGGGRSPRRDRSRRGSPFLPAEAIVASDPAAERRRLLSSELGVACVEDNAVPAGCPRVVLAVKPQAMPKVVEGVSAAVRPDALVITIAAGVTTSLLDQKLKGKGRIVRVMPNTPMLVGEGMSAVAAGPRATDDDMKWTCELFGSAGQTVEVSEAMMDAVTAVSGSGPAYFFYLIEAMTAAGVAEGLPADVAALLARHTCAGAARMLIETGQPPEALRSRVTSPGGTTQRAIETMNAAGVKDAIVKAVRAAAQRSRELGS